MDTSSLNRRDGELRSAEITGHAESGEYGLGVVHRFLRYLLTLSTQLTNLLGYEPELGIKRRRGGSCGSQSPTDIPLLSSKRNDLYCFESFLLGMANFSWRTHPSSSKQSYHRKLKWRKTIMLKLNLANLQLFAPKKRWRFYIKRTWFTSSNVLEAKSSWWTNCNRWIYPLPSTWYFPHLPRCERWTWETILCSLKLKA